VRILNQSSNSVTHRDKITEQIARIRGFYTDSEEPPAATRLLKEIKAAVRPFTGRYVDWVRQRMNPQLRNQAESARVPHDWPETFRRCDQWLEEKNRRVVPEILFRQEETGAQRNGLSASPLPA
jgi:hypothetical protein